MNQFKLIDYGEDMESYDTNRKKKDYGRAIMNDTEFYIGMAAWAILTVVCFVWGFGRIIHDIYKNDKRKL